MSAETTFKSQLQQEQRSELFWAASNAWQMTKRSVMHIIRSSDQLMSAAMMPIMFMLLNRYVFGGAINTGPINYATYIFPGIFVQMLAFGANYTTINLAIDMKEGIIDRLKSLPMASSALIVGHVVADLVRNIFSGLIIIAVAYLVGFRPNAGLSEWMLVIGLAIMFTLAISWLSAILGLLVKSLEAAQWMGFVVIFPLTFVSSAFVPTETMPSVLRAFAENQPLTKVMDSMRGWLTGNPAGNDGWIAFAWCLATIVICVPITAWLFQRKTAR